MMRRHLALLLFFSVFCARAQSIDHFKASLDSLRSRLHIPGMSVALMKDQRVIWASGFGYADLEHQVKTTAQTPYPIASITKPIAATLFLQLMEQQQVSLEDPLKKYYPRDFQTERVRVKHILTHTAAAPEGGKAGDRYAYSGSWYAYLAHVIAAVSCLSFRDQLVYQLLQPLHMNHSVPGHDVLQHADSLAARYGKSTLRRYKKILSRMAKPYTLYGEGNNVRSPYPPTFISSTAGLISTVTDLAKFDDALDQHVLINKETQDLAWTPFQTNNGQKIPYGLGWFVQDIDETKVIWHYGQWPVFSGLYIKVPQKNLTLILLANSNGVNAPFDLDKGNILVSPFAITFLKQFVFPTHDFAPQQKEAGIALQNYLDERSRKRP